jgi:hypothetical protein
VFKSVTACSSGQKGLDTCLHQIDAFYQWFLTNSATRGPISTAYLNKNMSSKYVFQHVQTIIALACLLHHNAPLDGIGVSCYGMCPTVAIPFMGALIFHMLISGRADILCTEPISPLQSRVLVSCYVMPLAVVMPLQPVQNTLAPKKNTLLLR